ncbi:MAG TPA: AAA family ATPase [Pyrinomonadaceae bacterium]
MQTPAESPIKSPGSKAESADEVLNESQETRRFESSQIRGSSSAFPRPGMVLKERYRLDGEIGRGAMGIVFRATDLELLRPVAVKILADRIGLGATDGRTAEAGRTTGEEKRKGGRGKEGTGEKENPSLALNAGETPAVPGQHSPVPGTHVITPAAGETPAIPARRNSASAEKLVNAEAGKTPAVPTTVPVIRQEATQKKAETGNDNLRSRFMREARAAAALNHPHIVAIYDIGEDHGFPFFVMELVDGPNLAHTPVSSVAQVVEFAVQICAALEHAHNNHIVHRDLKPANVLLAGWAGREQLSELKSEISDVKAGSSNLQGSATEREESDEGFQSSDSKFQIPDSKRSERDLTFQISDLKPSERQVSDSKFQFSHLKGVTVKLADLGLALPARGSRISHAGTIVGTAAYMAPEQALGRTVDGRADLYALGVLLYELTTGRVPFPGDNPLATISQHLHAPPVPPRVLRPDLPRALETVILRLLAKDPEQRYATAAETAIALRGAISGVTEAAEEDGASAVALLDALSRGRLVGRAEELGEARELWRRAQEGRGHCLLFSGEPGSGKTRLAREVIVQATLDGAVVLSGACYEYEAATPYLPFVEAFRRWIREQKDDGKLKQLLGEHAPQIAKLAPEIETRVGPFPSRHELPAHEERLLFFDAVTGLFARLARRQSLFFYLDDLHWADSGTLWLLGHLIRNLRDERVLIVASYRDTELDRAHPLSKALVDWNRERFTTRIGLKRFGPEETRAQIGALLDDKISGAFSEAVYRETEGNPFFVEEVMKALIEQGSVRRESGQWKRCELVDLVIPQSVKEAIGNRLDRVSAECNETLRAAAVLGKTFTIDELTAATEGLNENKLLDALDEAVAAQLLAADAAEAFIFTHDKIREVLYEELNPIRRRRLHLRTAEGLERHRERAPVAVETLAHHFIHAGEYQRGLTYAKQAAVEAEKIFAYDEAMAAYGRALECAEALGLEDEQLLLEEASGNAALASGDTLRATVHFDRALALAQDPQERARIQCQAASSLVTNGDPRGLDYVHQALQVLNPETNPLETANALAIEGRFHHLAGRHHEAIALLEQAVALVEPALEKEITPFGAATLSTTYGFLAGGHQHLGRFADGNVVAWKSVEFGNTHGVPLAQALGYEFLGENSVNMGDWQNALQYAAREREIAARLHSRERQAWTYLVTGLSHYISGSLESAERELREGMALAESIGEHRLALLLKGNLAIVLADCGRFDEAFATARENFTAAEALGLLYSRNEGRRCLAHVHFRKGEFAETLRLCDEVLELLGDKTSRVIRLWLGPLHIEALFAAGQREEARRRLNEYEALVGDCQAPRCELEVVRLKRLLEN